MPDIKLRNGSGVEQVYSGVDTITVPLADGSGYHTFGLSDEELTFEASGELYLFTSVNDALMSKYVNRIKIVPTEYSSKKWYVPNRLSSFSTIKDLSSIVFDCEGVHYFVPGNLLDNSGVEKLPKVINNENTAIGLGSAIFSMSDSVTEDEILEFLQGFTYGTEYINRGGYGAAIVATPYRECKNLLDASEVNAKWHEILNNEKTDKSFSSNPNYGGIQYTNEYAKSVRNIPIQYIDTTKRTSKIGITPEYRIIPFCDSFAFATDNGTPYAMNWKSMVFDFGTSDSYPFGYANNPYTQYQNASQYAQGFWKLENNIFTSNSMTIDEAKARYDQLKSRDDWYSCTNNNVTYDGKSLKLSMLFSRYNHDSAVETINSLPDTSAYLATAGGTNTIKFKKYAGALTDGGAIGNLTEEEIAVAAAKGWTVSLV